MLRQGTWVQLSHAAGCQIESLDIETALLDEGEQHQHSNKDHEDHASEHHEEMKEGEGHNEFHISYQYHCHQSDALTGAEVKLWQHFDGFERILGQLISNGVQQRFELTRGNANIRF